MLVNHAIAQPQDRCYGNALGAQVAYRTSKHLDAGKRGVIEEDALVVANLAVT